MSANLERVFSKYLVPQIHALITEDFLFLTLQRIKELEERIEGQKRQIKELEEKVRQMHVRGLVLFTGNTDG